MGGTLIIGLHRLQTYPAPQQRAPRGISEGHCLGQKLGPEGLLEPEDRIDVCEARGAAARPVRGEAIDT